VPDSIALQAATDQDRLALDRLHIRASAMMAPRTAQDLHRERGTRCTPEPQRRPGDMYLACRQGMAAYLNP
jgi:hypothetical protein